MFLLMMADRPRSKARMFASFSSARACPNSAMLGAGFGKFGFPLMHPWMALARVCFAKAFNPRSPAIALLFIWRMFWWLVTLVSGQGLHVPYPELRMRAAILQLRYIRPRAQGCIPHAHERLLRKQRMQLHMRSHFLHAQALGLQPHTRFPRMHGRVSHVHIPPMRMQTIRSQLHLRSVHVQILPQHMHIRLLRVPIMTVPMHWWRSHPHLPGLHPQQQPRRAHPR